MERTKHIEVWDLQVFLKDHKIVSVEEGEKTGSLEEKIENLRASSEALSKTAPDPENEFHCATAPGVVFTSAAERAAHYKTEWHYWNLKLRAAGLKEITKQEFEDFSNAGDIVDRTEEEETSKSDQSEEASEDHAVIGKKGSSQVNFITADKKKLSLWKNVVILDPHSRYTDLKIFIDGVTELHSKTLWVILMSSGGRFAGGVFDKNQCLQHKTFQRYTVRKKQGGTQSTKDKSGNKPKSVGATIRRQQETQFKEDVTEVLVKWRDHISRAHFIFIYGPGLSWSHFFAAGELQRDDIRIRTVPIPVRRPTLLEVKHVHSWLSRAEISDYVETPHVTPNVAANDLVDIDLQLNSAEASAPVADVLHEDKISDAIKANDLQALKLLFEQNYEPVLTEENLDTFTPALFLAASNSNTQILKYLLELGSQDINCVVLSDFQRTPLHKATMQGSCEMTLLLLNAGSDPTIKDSTGRTPYQVGKSKEVQKAMRIYAADNIEKWDWKKAVITPLSRQEAEQQRIKQQENRKKKAENAKIKKKEKQKEAQKEEENKQMEREPNDNRLALVLVVTLFIGVGAFLYYRHENKVRYALAQAALEKEVLNTASERETMLAAMSDREKRAFAAESRMNGNTLICEQCQKSFNGIPFHRLGFKYCSTDCVRMHMTTLEMLGKNKKL